MAGVAPQPAQQPNLLQILTNRIGLGGALQLISLLSPGVPAAQKGLNAARLGTLGLGVFGINPTFGDYGITFDAGKLGNLGNAGILPSAIGAAGVGYNLSQIASDPNLSLGQKVGHSAFDTGGAVASAYNPYVGLGLLARGVIGKLTQSGSPQVAATGRALQGPALPVEGLINVITGDMSAREAGNNMIASTGRIPVVGHAMKQALQAFGLGTPSTTGTVMRDEVTNIAGQLGLKGFKADRDALTPEQYNTYKPETQKTAYALADLIGSYSPSYKKGQKDYQIQIGNDLLKQYGDTVPDLVRQILAPQPPPGAITSAAQLQANSNNNWATNLVNRYKTTGSVV